ncbi:MAG: NusG domain II-containing protein [Fluviibacter sp.]
MFWFAIVNWSRLLQTRRLLRPGDALVLLAGIAVWVMLSVSLWQSGPAAQAQVRRDGVLVAAYDLNEDRTVSVTGPIGTTVIRIEAGRARVLSDPGPRQYCVRQGWLTRPGEMALCAPNHISLSLTGGQPAYESMAY